MLILTDTVKHPLENAWSFWMFTSFHKKNWEDNLVEMTTFDTVEDYWCLYHHMKLPSELELGQDYMVFKQGIQPMWEDTANRKGGRWLLMFDGSIAPHLNAVWSDTVLLLIGENFTHSDQICGVVVNIRDKSKISIWMRSTDHKAVIEVGRKLKRQFKFLGKIHFYKHNGSRSLHSF